MLVFFCTVLSKIVLRNYTQSQTLSTVVLVLKIIRMSAGTGMLSVGKEMAMQHTEAAS